MNGCKLRITMIVVCAVAVCAAMPRVQAQVTSGMTSASGADYARKATSSGSARGGTADSAGASTWTAGKSEFGSADRGGWAGGKPGFGSTGAASWTAGATSFGQKGQPGGIWRAEGAVPMNGVGTAAVSSEATPSPIPETTPSQLSETSFSEPETTDLAVSVGRRRGFDKSRLGHAGRSALATSRLPHATLGPHFEGVGGGRGRVGRPIGSRNRATGFGSNRGVQRSQLGHRAGLGPGELGRGATELGSGLNSLHPESKFRSGSATEPISPGLKDPLDQAGPK